MDLFDEDIHYNDTNSSIGASQAQYNGNISYIVWKVAGREKQGYAYQYDDLDRLTNATYADMQDYNYSNQYSLYTTDNKFGESATYDVRGNIKTLQRRGLQQYGTNNGFAAGVFGPIDNLNYNYLDANNPDRLSGVTDATGSAKGFAANWTGTSDYSYDANGNLYTDRNKGLTIYYNHMNLPRTILNNNLGGRVDFLYDAAGNKLKKTVTDVNGNVTYKYYADGVEFDNMYYAPTTFYNGEGRLNFDANANAWYYEYALKDHLGNTRVVFADRNGDGKIDPFSEVSQINHYYPFGLNLEGNWNGGTGAYKKQYNGKEWNDDLGLNMNDYGARWYDPAIARWTSIDPKGDKYSSFSPYNYTLNNPIKFIDPDGKDIIIPKVKTDGYTHKNLGDDENQQRHQLQIFSQLQSLTNDKLIMDSKGRVTIKEYGEGKFKEGTAVVRGLIEGFQKGDSKVNKVFTLLYTEYTDNPNGGFPINKKNSQNGVGSDISIYFNPSLKSGACNIDGTTTRESFIALAHELIHGKHSFLGIMKFETLMLDYLDVDSGGRNVNLEELNTKNAEQFIRAEHNIILRDVPFYFPDSKKIKK